MRKTTQNGFAHLGLLLLVLVAAIAFVGYKVVQNSNNSSVANTVTTPKAAQVIPSINSTADLNTAETTLNRQNVDGDLNPDSLNDDVNSLL